MQSAGIPAPIHQLVADPFEMIDPELRYPLFPKLNNMHSSLEIDKDSVCRNEKELRQKLKIMFEKYKQPILIDEFVAGKEVSVAVLDGGNTKVYPAERVFESESEENFLTFDDKWGEDESLNYVKYNDVGELKKLTKKAFEVLKMSDYARFDVRVDGAGRYYFIDANTNPFFGPAKEVASSFGYILELYGVSFEDVLRRLMENTLKDIEGSGAPGRT